MQKLSMMDRKTLVPALVLVLGLMTQAIWQFAVPWSWNWDSATNLAIGRMYFHLPYQMWDIKNYYGPGYGIFMTLMGVHHLDTLRYFALATWLTGGTLPYFLFRAVEPFNRTAATIAALVFAGVFGNAVLSTDMMNHHFHAFSLVVMTSFFSQFYFNPSLANGTWFSLASALSNAVRGTSAFIFVWAVAVLAIAAWAQRRRLRSAGRVVLVLAGLYVVMMLVLSIGRTAALGGRFQYGLTEDVGVRVMFQGAYYGASIFEKEFYPDEDPIFVRPENGPASESLFASMRTYLSLPGVDLRASHLSPNNDKDEAYRSLIMNPTHGNTYVFWWGYDHMVKGTAAQRQLRKVVVETIVAQPRIVKYYAWNLWNYLFGPELVPDTTCIVCVCPPCFHDDDASGVRGGAFMGEDTFSFVAGSGLIAEMRQEFHRAESIHSYGQAANAVVRFAFGLKPVLTMLLLVAVLTTHGATRYLSIYLLGAVLVLAGTTSLAWPDQFRYVYPIYPLLFAGAALGATAIGSQAHAIWRLRGTKSS